MESTTSKIRDYISIARPNHWTKHIFIVPGIIFAVFLIDDYKISTFNLLIGLLSACLISSGNYVLNEILDAESDKHHPLKSQRPLASGKLSKKIAYLEYAVLAALGIGIALYINQLFFITSVIFFISGVTYNVYPIRTKDRVYLDVLTEAFNNPIRLMLGWSMISSTTIPPISLIITYWFGGAFLMATKRYSEYRFIERECDKEALILYRNSFKYYSESKLLVSTFLYAILSAFNAAVFLIKYRIELFLTIPFFAALFTYYLALGTKPISVVQAPENLYKDKGLVIIVAILVLAFVIFSFIDIPILERVLQSRFVEINLAK